MGNDELKKAVGIPNPGDFSIEAIRKEVFSEAIQHPTTLLGAAATLLSGAYMGIISFDPTAFAVAVGSALFTVASWVFHFFVRGDKIKQMYLERLKSQQNKAKVQQVVDMERNCMRARFDQGVEAARELQQAYLRLDGFLKEKQAHKNSPQIQKFILLAEDTYYQGLHFIGKALALYQVLGQMDIKKLKQELIAWENALKGIQTDTGRKKEERDNLIRALEDRIESHKKRLNVFDDRRKGIAEALAQCEILEATLDSTYLGMVELIDVDTFALNSNAANSLERAFNAAKRVDERLRKAEQRGGMDDFDDSIYTQAARGNDDDNETERQSVSQTTDIPTDEAAPDTGTPPPIPTTQNRA